MIDKGTNGMRAISWVLGRIDLYVKAAARTFLNKNTNGMRTISRVLSRRIIYLAAALPHKLSADFGGSSLSVPSGTSAVKQLTQGPRPGKPQTPFVKPCSGWGLSQSRPSPDGTVSSCLTFSPLPAAVAGGGRSVLCDTVLSPRQAGRNPCWGSSFPAEPGLSSPCTQERGDSSSASR
jgi:hypothetical protein